MTDILTSGTHPARMRVFTRFLSTAFLLESALPQASPQAPVCIHHAEALTAPSPTLSSRSMGGRSRGLTSGLSTNGITRPAHSLFKNAKHRLEFICHLEKALRFYDAFMTRIHLGDTLSTVFPLTFPIHLASAAFASAALPQQTLCATLRLCAAHHRGTGLRNLKSNGKEGMTAAASSLPSPDLAFKKNRSCRAL